MGIKSLTYLIKQQCEQDCIETKKLYELSGKRVAIDASLYIYQSLINIRKDGDTFKNKKGNDISHLLGIFNKTLNLLTLNIEPIYIFDGKPPKEKQDIINKRKKIASDCKQQIVDETDLEKINSLKKKTVRLTYEIVEDVKNLLEVMGVSYIHMEGEAEGLASELCRLKYVDYIMTEDMDSLVFGCPMLIRKCIHRNVKIKDSITIFNLEKILDNFKLNFDQFVELCILCGCDYCPNIPKIGSITAFKLIQNFGTVEKFLEYNKINNKYSVPEDYVEKFNTSKLLFNIFKDKINLEKLNENKSDINYEKLTEYLTDYLDMSESKVIGYIDKLKNKYKIE
jgi:flap endonuclease-1